jgi:hypothetical protein
MAFTPPYGMLEIGSDGFPLIDGTLFTTIMDFYGFNIRRRRKSEVQDCPCFDPYGKSADPDCEYCEGTGSLAGWEDRVVRGLLMFKAPKGNWAIGNQRTIAGDIERMAVMGFFPGGTDIQMDDLIILNTAAPNASSEVWIEFRVDSLYPRMVGNSRGSYTVVFQRADLRRVEYPVSAAFPP